MESIPQVEAAKILMTEAVSWSVMKWLREKKRVRKTADQANAALDQLNQSVKERWPDALRAAYKALVTQGADNATTPGQPAPTSPAIDPQSSLSAKKVKEADDAAYRARMDAEETFDEAERQLSTRLAREGCRKAIQSWELHEKAIRKGEALVPSKQ
ncbi:MAG TPA: hypothetical protein VE377_05330 [Candidatus Dormibacteraeota bacterium]|nr:hypothetical protein [Candidatus Dormibacteraeota bacterium]